MKKCLFIYRDGSLVRRSDSIQPVSNLTLELVPGVIGALKRITQRLDYRLVLLTSQQDVTDTSQNNFITRLFLGEGVSFQTVQLDTTPGTEIESAQPDIRFLQGYMNSDFDLANSFVIGSKVHDMQLAQVLGTQGIFLATEEQSSSNDEHNAPLSEMYQVVSNWNNIATILCNIPRQVRVSRKTSETSIDIKLNLDGAGNATISTGIGFYDHMLEQIARHGAIDLDIQTIGDLHIDGHHSIEDTALALGEAFKQAIKQRKGFARYGFVLPMDDCLSQVAIDFGGRPALVWDAEFKRERIGEMPTEMFSHFFKSFSDAALCNINIRAEGDNEHHKIESIFKAFARAIQMAVAQTESSDVPSTKGVL